MSPKSVDEFGTFFNFGSICTTRQKENARHPIPTGLGVFMLAELFLSGDDLLEFRRRPVLNLEGTVVDFIKAVD